ncbi:MAG: c-type cytochrome domain-containing protein [Fuerstiella sp.]
MIRFFDKHVVRSLAAILLAIAATNVVSADDKVNFEDHVKPIFRAKCFSCHNTNKKTADLDLSNYTAMMQGGGSGEVIEPGSADDSYLFMVMNHDTEPVMPPNADRLPDATLDTVRKWIDQGAPENSSSKVSLPKKPKVSLSVDVSAGARPEGAPPLPDVLNLEPVVHTSATTAVSAIATSPWAKLVAVAGQKQVILYHSETLAALGVLPFPEGQARVLKFSRNGALLLAGGGQGAARGLAVVWDIKSGKRMMEVGDELDEVLAADISADQTLVAVGGPQKVVRVYRTDTGELAYEITKHTDWIYNLEFSPDGVLLATGDRNGGLHVWEALTGREYLTLKDHKKAITALSFRIDGNILASASEDNTVKLWEMEEGKAIKSWNAHGGGVLSMEFCRDGRVVSSGRDRVAKIWDQNGKQLRAFPALKDLAVQVSHCDEVDRVIAGDWTGAVRVWNAADGKQLGELTTNPPLLASRLKIAQDKLATLKPQLETARTAAEKAKVAQSTHQQQLAAAVAQKMASEKATTESKTGLAAQQKQLAEYQGQQKSLTTEIQDLKKVVPELSAAVTRTATAAKMMSEDKDLVQLVSKLQAKLNTKTARQKQIEASLIQAKTQIGTLTTSTAKLQQTLLTAQATVQSSTATVKTLTANKKAIDDAVNATSPKVTILQQQVNDATTEVQRWTLYAALRDDLKAAAVVAEKRDTVQLASLEVAAELEEMQSAVQQVERQVQEADASVVAANQQKAQMQKQIQQATAAKAAALATSKKHELALPLLQQAKQQAVSAAALLPDQAEMKQAVTSIDQTINVQTAAIQKIQTTVGTLDQKVVAAQQTMKTAEAKVAEMTTVKNAAVQKAAELSKQVQPLQSKAEKAKQQLAVVEQELVKARATVEARRAQLRPVIQIRQASR